MFGGPLAAMSGLLAALASVFSKLALEEEGRTIANVFKHIIASDYDYSVLVCNFTQQLYLAFICILSSQLLALRIICFMLMFVCNALMWTTFTKALQGVSSTVEVTVTNSSANLFFTVSIILEPKKASTKPIECVFFTTSRLS